MQFLSTHYSRRVLSPKIVSHLRICKMLMGISILSVVAIACPRAVPDRDILSVEGSIERNSAVEPIERETVDVSFASSSARAEWWPCDLRLTAAGCFGDSHHVNVFLALPTVVEIDGDRGLARAACVQNGVPDGMFEKINRSGTGTYQIGVDVSAYVLLASEVDGTAGVDFADRKETSAAVRLVSGSVDVVRFDPNVDGSIALTIRATTADGNTVDIEFDGAASFPAVVVPIDPPDTCVAGAAVE